MSDGIRDELRELLFDSAPPAEVDREALFARTFAAEEGAGADLLPPDGLFDLPADDPADEGLLTDEALFTDEAALDDGFSADAGSSDGDSAADDAGVDPDTTDVWGDPAAGDPAGDDPAGAAPDVPFEPGAGW
jgi:hypothetical protein